MKIISLIIFLVPSLALADRQSYNYRSLREGGISFYTVKPDKLDLYRAYIAEKNSDVGCGTKEYHCVASDAVKFAIPKNLGMPGLDGDDCKIPEWSYDDVKYRVIYEDDHGVYNCEKGWLRKDITLLGNKVSGYWVRGEGRHNDRGYEVYLLWSPDIGVISFSSYYGSERFESYWLAEKCGLFSSKLCGS